MIFRFDQMRQDEKERISLENVNSLIAMQQSMLSNPFLTSQMRKEIQEQIREFELMREYARRTTWET